MEDEQSFMDKVLEDATKDGRLIMIDGDALRRNKRILGTRQYLGYEIRRETSGFDPDDTTAFALADYGSFGNSGRNILDGPGYRDVSISIVKDTVIRDEISVQFRTEFLNAFNSVNFDLPDSFYGSQTFGSIHSAQDPRRIQFGLKIIF